jgi:hypothetical protein
MTLTLNYGDYHRHMTKEQWRKAISAETLAEHGNMSEMERMVLPSYRDNRMLYWAKKHCFSISTTALDWQSAEGISSADTSPRFSILWAGRYSTPWDAPNASTVGHFYGQASELSLFVDFLNKLTARDAL